MQGVKGCLENERGMKKRCDSVFWEVLVIIKIADSALEKLCLIYFIHFSYYKVVPRKLPGASTMDFFFFSCHMVYKNRRLLVACYT